MEPGHEDREYVHAASPRVVVWEPQWSPVMKTGNTYVRGWGRNPPAGLNGARS